MHPDRRPSRRNTLRSPAMAKPHPLGAAMGQALHGDHTAPPQGRPQYRFSRSGWSSGGWQSGRALTPRVVEAAQPTWSYAKTNSAAQGGFALVELMLVIGVIAIGTAGVVATYRVVDNNRKINDEVEHAQVIAQNVVAHGVTSGNFSAITQENAIRDRLFPRDMLDADGTPRNKWGGEVLLASETIAGRDNWGAALTFEGVPASACSKLVNQAASGFYGVRVNENVLRSNYSAINAAALAEECASGDASTVQFIYAKHGGAGDDGGGGSLTPCTVPSPTTDTIIDSACPSGQIGTVVFQTNYICPDPFGSAVAQPPLQLSSTCTPICTPPATITDRETRNHQESGLCPPGRDGSVLRERPEERTRTLTDLCSTPPGFSGPVMPIIPGEYTPFSPWVATGPWTTVSNTCTTPCTPQSPTVTPYSQSASCSPGTVTPSGSSTFTQSRTGTVSYHCPGRGGPIVASPESFTEWSPTAATACAPVCTAPPTVNTPISRPAPPETQSLNCPSGQAGTWTQQRSRRENGTSRTTYSCPAPTGNYVTNPAQEIWHGTYSNFGRWEDTANTCAPLCVAPPSTTETQTQNGTCRGGQITPGGSPSFTQSSTRTISYSCPNPTGPYTTTPGPWSVWSPDSTQACAPSCAASLPPNTTETSTTTESQRVPCSQFRVGEITQERSATRTRSVIYTCPAPTGGYTTQYGEWSAATYSPWTNVSSTCSLPACDGTLEGNARNYMARYTDLYNAFGTNYSAAYEHWYTRGYNEGRESCWGPPCKVPAPQTQWLSTSDTACPAGTSGTRYYQAEQQRDGVCSSPTGTPGFGGWYNTGRTRNMDTSQCKRPCEITASTPGRSRSWNGALTNTCSGNLPIGTYANGTFAPVSYVNSRDRIRGDAQFQCNDGTFSTTAAPGATCARN